MTESPMSSGFAAEIVSRSKSCVGTVPSRIVRAEVGSGTAENGAVRVDVKGPAKSMGHDKTVCLQRQRSDGSG